MASQALPAARFRSSSPGSQFGGRQFSAFLAPLFLLALWQFACSLDIFPPQILVPPSSVAWSLVDMAASGELQRHVGDSLRRLALGFLIGAVLGMAFGAAMALSRLFEALFSPLFYTIWQVPVIAFIPMMVMFLGIDEPFKLAVVAIAAFFPMALATFDGIRSVPRNYFEVARVYRLHMLDLIRRILLPATVPAVLTGVRISLTRAWIVLVAAELLAADSGIGQMMEMGRQLFQIDVVLAGVVVSGLIGFLLDRGARYVESRASRWRTI
ncbi:sulfonate transport system permease protein [Sphingobium sp. B1D7B]|uniref:ABC transporter permease n=1 Tax=Sphingobium sp. B1D7B TaxID=2940578 RepID=UPI00222459D1|nr:ABC transporter permease [Sphingobium sp. B1D7B]MCW2404624.1 sulfonate transport system permease protein [Sphingobium sp. B1D7B]